MSKSFGRAPPHSRSMRARLSRPRMNYLTRLVGYSVLLLLVFLAARARRPRLGSVSRRGACGRTPSRPSARSFWRRRAPWLLRMENGQAGGKRVARRPRRRKSFCRHAGKSAAGQTIPRCFISINRSEVRADTRLTGLRDVLCLADDPAPGDCISASRFAVLVFGFALVAIGTFFAALQLARARRSSPSRQAAQRPPSGAEGSESLAQTRPRVRSRKTSR